MTDARDFASAPEGPDREQAGLPGFDGDGDGAPPRHFVLDAVADPRGKLMGHTLFVAIVPRLDDTLRIERESGGLRQQYHLTGHDLPSERKHVTLVELKHFDRSTPVSQPVVEAARAAGRSVSCPPIEIVFNRVMTFQSSGAFVMCCDDRSDAAVARLRQSLVLASRAAGLDPKPSRTPHMTMLYDPQRIAVHPIDPIRWTATRFALILSHVGLGHHQWIDEWTLAG